MEAALTGGFTMYMLVLLVTSLLLPLFLLHLLLWLQGAFVEQKGAVLLVAAAGNDRVPLATDTSSNGHHMDQYIGGRGAALDNTTGLLVAAGDVICWCCC